MASAFFDSSPPGFDPVVHAEVQQAKRRWERRASETSAWIAGHRRNEVTPFCERLSPGNDERKNERERTKRRKSIGSPGPSAEGLMPKAARERVASPRAGTAPAPQPGMHPGRVRLNGRELKLHVSNSVTNVNRSVTIADGIFAIIFGSLHYGWQSPPGRNTGRTDQWPRIAFSIHRPCPQPAATPMWWRRAGRRAPSTLPASSA